MATREQIVKQAQAWIGRKESNGTHKYIIDVYNTIKPLPRSYPVKYTDEWCATFVSAVGKACNANDIIFAECGCGQMIELYKKAGAWVENDAYVPSPGDIIFYDWSDSGSGNNLGYPDHVGIVEKVANGTITVIEGNYSTSVKRRELKVNGRYIRGYGVPKYAATAPKTKTIMVELTQLEKGMTGEEVKTLQRLLLALGYNMNGYGADGSFGNATYNAVIRFQKANGLEQDGIVGTQTWRALLK